MRYCDDVDLVLVEAPHVGVLPGEGGDHGDLVQAHQARTQHGLHVTRLPRHGDCQTTVQSKLRVTKSTDCADNIKQVGPVLRF